MIDLDIGYWGSGEGSYPDYSSIRITAPTASLLVRHPLPDSGHSFFTIEANR